MLRPKVVVLSTMSPEQADIFRSFAPEDIDVVFVDNGLTDIKKIPECQDAEAIILVGMNITTNLIQACPRIKLLQTISAGFNHLPLAVMSEMGIPVANNGGANRVAAAEETVGLMLGVHRGIMLHWRSAKNKLWRDQVRGMTFGEVSGKTVGIVGLGRIGREVARRLIGFGTRTLYYDVIQLSPQAEDELHVTRVSYDKLLRMSDFVTFHVPLQDSTWHMLGRRELGLMKTTAYIINTSRGSVVDEKALIQALLDKRIAGAGLDVLEEEPTPGSNPLLEMDNVFITPHMAGFTKESTERGATFAFANARRAVMGEPLESLVGLES